MKDEDKDIIKGIINDAIKPSSDEIIGMRIEVNHLIGSMDDVREESRETRLELKNGSKMFVDHGNKITDHGRRIEDIECDQESGGKALAQQAFLYGIIILPSSELSLEFLPLLHRQQIVEDSSFNSRTGRRERALDIVDDATEKREETT